MCQFSSALSELEAMMNDHSGDDFMKRIGQSELDVRTYVDDAQFS